ncbi:hypothetical protein LTR62_007786 [Meristemomyces frigidus]|uniref:Uncharacterized protein n=1 Tax=Meristemomyces frigidus TaxID=1508187 RepID=A0AAN7TBN7_9PEZI|nr:hypothetical protein LTR62_007786 [Meristemomyces frigidus]
MGLRSRFVVLAIVCIAGPLPYALTQHLQRPLISNQGSLIPRLNFSSPSPLIFHSVFGLLQQWPNTYFPNGHIIAPCTVPRNTNLYHARRGPSLPPSPEWFAFDPEMSYAIAGIGRDSHLLTYRTTKDVKCLYFDGTSASLEDDGSMDAQMLLLHNISANVPEHPGWAPLPPRNATICFPGRNETNCTHWNPLQAEYDRANGLCDLITSQNLGGPGWGFEGIVRMNTGFEMIWCNFKSTSARLVSHLNVSVPLYEIQPDHQNDERLNEVDAVSDPRLGYLALSRTNTSHPPSGRPVFGVVRHPFIFPSLYEWFHAGAKRYGFASGVSGAGETRVHVDSGAIFTLYDPVLIHQERARVFEEMHQYNLTKDGHWTAPIDPIERQAALTKFERRRRWQMVRNIDVHDGEYMRKAVLDRMRGVLNQSRTGTGIDWIRITREIVLTYNGPLLDLRAHLTASTLVRQDPDALRNLTKTTRRILRGLWMPYFETPAFNHDNISKAFDTSAPQVQYAYELCRNQYEPTDADLSRLTASENVTYTAIQEIVDTICGTLLSANLNTEKMWLQHFNNITVPSRPRTGNTNQEQKPFHLASDSLAAVRQSLHATLEAVELLTAWLAWSDQQTACSPACTINQKCAIPMWPIGNFLVTAPLHFHQNGSMNGGGEGYYNDDGYGRKYDWVAENERALWEPECVDAEMLVERWEGRFG